MPLEIFTLNYDGLIELFCENCGLNYSDGFSPFWSPDVFDNDKINVRIYRLHGSLYWFKISSGKMMRIPIRGLKLNEVRYISGSYFNEMIIYPTLEKEKYSELYSYLSNKFITKLNQCTFCVVVGYSFRDKDVTDNLIEAIRNNRNLWIIIISPNASSKKAQYFESLDKFSSTKVITINMDIKEILLNGRFYEFLDRLKWNITRENLLWKKQYQLSDPSIEWYELIRHYFDLDLVDRVQYIRNRLEAYGLTPDRVNEIIESSKRASPHLWPSNRPSHT